MPGWDYSQGAYFITICTVNSSDMFGHVVDREMKLNAFGAIVAESWRWLAGQYTYVVLDEWSILPTHMHGILVLATDVAGKETIGAPRTAAPRKPLGQLVGAFKTRSTKEVNRLRQTPGKPLWQRDFWERVIRDEYDMTKVRAYIRGNAAAYRPRTYTVTL